jgi:enoyl-CoA hydratase
MTDIHIRRSGHVGRITLQRPDALNAMTYNMCQKIDAALKSWADDSSVKCVLIDALGKRAFCAGGDIADLYATGKAGDYEYGQTFWAEEYRTNALIAEYPKPYVAFHDGRWRGYFLSWLSSDCRGKQSNRHARMRNRAGA